MTASHACHFPEVVIEEADSDSVLRAGMRVLAPCECGELPLDHVSILEAEMREALDALAATKPQHVLFHWSPSVRRGQITRYGLRPRMRPTTSSVDEPAWRAPCVCFADSPSWAWALSGGMPWTPRGEWDLWQTTLDRLTDPIILPSPDRASGIYEVRTEHRVFKRDLFYVASRTIRPTIKEK